MFFCVLARAGDNCFLRRCVVDENATIGNNVQIINKSGVAEADRSESERRGALGLGPGPGTSLLRSGMQQQGGREGRRCGCRVRQGRETCVAAHQPDAIVLRCCCCRGF